MASDTWRSDPRLQLLEEAKMAQAGLDNDARQAAVVTFNQAQVLALLDLLGSEATVSTLASKLERAVHTLTSAVTGLQVRGLAERFQKAGEDRRIVRIRLTAAGKDALSKLRATSLPLP